MNYRPLPFLFVCCCIFLLNITQAQNVKTLLDNAPQSHPRLFLPAGAEAELQTKLDGDPLLTQAKGHVIQVADSMLELPPLERIQEGRRLLAVSREALRRLTYLSMAYRLTGESRYAKCAEKNMLAIADFSDWNPSHFLDVAEMTAALAIGYDWCYNALTPPAREIIRQAIIEKGLQASLEGEHWWVTRDNNWNQVCHAGMVLGALVVYEQEPDLSEQIIQRALDNIHHGMEVYQPDGAYPEGPTYWSYGTMFNVMLIDALESVLGSDFGLTQTPGFVDSAEYYLHVGGPSGIFFNYQDSGSNTHVTPSVYWFAARSENPALLWRERTEMQEFLAKEHKPTGAHIRDFPLLLVWAQPMGEMSPPQKLSWRGDGVTPVGLHRTSWDDEQAMFLGLKGGSPSASHGQMDVGTFVIESDGVRWAIDLGAQDYHDLESKGIQLWGEDRWKIFRLNNFSHNVLTVDNQLQSEKGHASIIKHSAEGPMRYTVLDTSEIYSGQLARSQRGAALHEDGYFLIRDELQALGKETKVRWGMATKAEVTLDNDRQATLKQDGETLTLQVLTPADAKLELYEMENPPADFDAKNPGVKMIGFTATLPADSEEDFTIVMTPGAQPATLETTALRDW